MGQVLALFLTLVFAVTQQVLAQSVTAASPPGAPTIVSGPVPAGSPHAPTAPVAPIVQKAMAPLDFNSRSTRPSGAVNLDLSSTTAGVGVGQLTNVTIILGNQLRTISSAELLTPSERIAAFQVFNTGRQSLALGSLGNAIGGSFIIGPNISSRIGSLTIPQNVTAIDLPATSQPLSISGNLSNFGSLYATSTNSAITSASISAANIFNSAGALISTVLPAGGLPGIHGSLSQLDLIMNAAQNIVNAGAISSSGNLSVTAGGTITNALPGGAAGATPLIQAQNDLYLTTGAGRIINEGNLSSHSGNVNLAAAGTQNLQVVNLGGQISAVQGAINLRGSAFQGPANTDLIGGDLFSKTVNVFSGSGIASINVGQLTGLLNVYGKEAHITSATANLALGKICLTGDPTFYNTAGAVVINSDLTFHGSSLAIIAATNITTSSGVGAIDTSSTTGSGGSILLVAGANFTAGPDNSSSTTSGNSSGAGQTGSSLVISGGSGGGGYIDLTGGAGTGGGTTPITAFTSSSSAPEGAGGDITIVAYKGTSTNSGRIASPTGVTINAGGGGGVRGNNGSINIIAGATSGTAVSAGNLNTSTGVGGTGTINVYAATPSNTTVNVDGNGTITSGSFTPGTVNAAAILAGALATGGGNIAVSSGATVGTGTISATNSGSGAGGTISLTANSTSAFAIGAGGTNGTGAITARGSGTGGDGGTVSATNNGTGGVSISSSSVIDVSPQVSGAGGNITLSSTGGPIALPSGTLSASAAGESGDFIGGTINVSGTAIKSAAGAVLTANGVNNGRGGTVQVTSTGAGALTLGTGTNQILAQVNGGSTGSAGTLVFTSGGNLVVDVTAAEMAAGSMSFQTTAGDITFGAIVGNATTVYLTLDAAGSVKTTAPADATDISIRSRSGNIVIGANLGSADTASLALNAAGSISQTNAGILLSGTTTTLTAGTSGDIGSSSMSLYTSAADLSAVAGGKVYVHNSGCVILSNAAAGTNFTLVNTGDLTVNGDMTVPVVAMSTDAGSNGTIAINANLTASGSLTLKTDGGGNILQTLGTTITTPTLTLASDSGDIGTVDSNINAVSSKIVANTGVLSMVYIFNTGNVNVGTSTAGDTFQFIAAGNVTLAGSVTAPNVDIETSTANKSIFINSSITASNSLTLKALGTGTFKQLAGATITSPAITLNADQGSIGTAGAPITTTTNMLTAGAGTNGSFYINNTGDIDLQSSSAGSTFKLVNDGNVTVSGDVTANDLTIATTTGSNGSIVLNANLTGANTVTLQAGGTASTITQAAGASVNGGSLALSSGGDIGSSDTAFTTSVSSMTARTSAGCVFVSNTGDVSVGTSTVAGQLVVSGSGNLATAGSIQAQSVQLTSSTGMLLQDVSASSGSIQATAGAGTLQVADSAALKVTEGNIVLKNADQTSGKIVVGSEAQLSATTADKASGFGQVIMTIGDLPPADELQVGPSVPNVTTVLSNGGAIYFGSNGIDAKASQPPITVAANGTNVIFNTGDLPSTAISLMGSVQISGGLVSADTGTEPIATAPPPPPPPAPPPIPVVIPPPASQPSQTVVSTDQNTGTRTPPTTTIVTVQQPTSCQTGDASFDSGGVISSGGSAGSTGSSSGGSTSSGSGAVVDTSSAGSFGEGGSGASGSSGSGNTASSSGSSSSSSSSSTSSSSGGESSGSTGSNNANQNGINGRGGPDQPQGIAVGGQNRIMLKADDTKTKGREYMGVTLMVGEEGDLVLFTTASQTYIGGFGSDDDSVIEAVPGTVISKKRKLKRTVILHTGRMVVDGGKESVTVNTRCAAVLIQPESSALVDVVPGKPVRIMALAGEDNKAARVSLKDGKEVNLNPGEELIVGDESLSDEDLIPTDGIDRQVVNAGLEIHEKNMVAKEIFSLPELLEKDLIIAGHVVRLGGYGKAAGTNRLVNKIAVAAARRDPAFNIQKLAVSERVMRSPVIIASAATARAESDDPDLASVGAPPVSMLAARGSTFKLNRTGNIDVVDGSAFLVLPTTHVINTPVGKVIARKGSLLSLDSGRTKMRVRACSGMGDVTVVAAGKKVALAIGQEILVADHRPEKSDALPDDGVGRRNVVAHAIDEKFTAVLSDFSIPSMIVANPHLLALRMPVTSEEKKVSDQLIKMSAVLQQVTSKHGPYLVQPHETSMVAPDHGAYR